jgi:hypothetical protein
MPIVSEKSLRFAVKNIVHFGDTDVFPFPMERRWFEADEEAVIKLLQTIDGGFDEALALYPVTFVKSLAGVGYHGFRAATQIDPIWDAYLLALVVEIGGDIESARVKTSQGVVFSYRYAPDDNTFGMFDKTQGWRAFQESGLERSCDAKFVLTADISDFYPRVYHHRLENALQLATKNKAAATRIIAVLSKLSGGTSYGLPIGGNAARLLAELLLNRVDRLMLASSVKFCRFVDDYTLFASSREDAQRALVALSDALLRNEGLTLSRAKSRFMSSSEFRRASPVSKPETADSHEESEAKKFLRIRWSYDPYSPTAEDDYESLVHELEKFDVVSMLATEFRKTRVDEGLVRQLVKSIRYLSSAARDQAVLSIVDNLNTLYPVFPTVAILLRAVLEDLSEAIVQHVFLKLRELVRDNSHIIMVPTNAVYTARLLAVDPDEESDSLLLQMYRGSNSDEMLKRDVIYAMAKRRAHYWLSETLKRHSQLTSWERRAVLAASYTLGDEGKFWRKQREKELNLVDRAFARWVASMNNGGPWEMPL